MKTFLIRLSMSLCILSMVMFAIGQPTRVEAAPKPSKTPAPTRTVKPTNTARPTNTPRFPFTPTLTATQPATATATHTPSPTFIVTASYTPTASQTLTSTPTETATEVPTHTPVVLVDTITVVTDNATTIPGGPAPVTFGGTIVFTATVSSASGTPNGTIRWSLSHEAPYYGLPEQDRELDQGSGIVGACQGDVPVLNGLATCEVTPGYWLNTGESTELPFYWGIRATATFTPAVGSSFAGSSGSDGTNKITTGDRIMPYCWAPPCDPFVAVDMEPGVYYPFWIGTTSTSDSLGRDLVFHWCVHFACPHSTSTPESVVLAASGLMVIELVAVCPAGIDFFHPSFQENWNGSFECNYPRVYVTLKNEHQGR